MMKHNVIYATYEDDGIDGPGAQGGNTFPAKRLLIFRDMSLAREYELVLETMGNGRKRPKITGFYSQDPDEILVSCWPAKIIEPLKYIPKTKASE
jgi:hypothetical protein